MHKVTQLRSISSQARQRETVAFVWGLTVGIIWGALAATLTLLYFRVI